MGTRGRRRVPDKATSRGQRAPHIFPPGGRSSRYSAVRQIMLKMQNVGVGSGRAMGGDAVEGRDCPAALQRKGSVERREMSMMVKEAQSASAAARRWRGVTSRCCPHVWSATARRVSNILTIFRRLVREGGWRVLDVRAFIPPIPSAQRPAMPTSLDPRPPSSFIADACHARPMLVRRLVR